MDKASIVRRLQDLELEKKDLLAEYNQICKAEWLLVNKVERCEPQRAPSKRRGSVIDELFKGIKI